MRLLQKGQMKDVSIAILTTLSCFSENDSIIVVVEAGRSKVPQHLPLHNATEASSQSTSTTKKRTTIGNNRTIRLRGCPLQQAGNSTKSRSATCRQLRDRRQTGIKPIGRCAVEILSILQSLTICDFSELGPVSLPGEPFQTT